MEERIERRDRRPEAEVNLAGDACLLSAGAADAGPLIADVAGNEPAILRQRQSHRKRAVAGEGTDLQRVLCPDEPDEKGEERCLLRAICICAIGIGAVTLRS